MNIRTFLKILAFGALAWGLIACTSPRPIATTIAVPPVPTATALPQTTSLREVDWNAVLTNDPELDHNGPACPNCPSAKVGPFVKTKNSTDKNLIGGYASPSDIFYGDISGDGQAEALIWLRRDDVFPECGPYNSGLLIYRMERGKPKLAAALGGDRLSATIQGGDLVVTEKLWLGFGPEGKCTRSGFRQTHYRLEASGLVSLAHVEVCDDGVCPSFIREFYGRLSEKNYRWAYAMLSPAFQAKHPFESWMADYQRFETIEAQDLSTSADGWVGVNLTEVERTSAGEVTQHWQGKWKLVWDENDPSGPQWLLDEAQFVQVP